MKNYYVIKSKLLAQFCPMSELSFYNLYSCRDFCIYALIHVVIQIISRF